MGGIQWTERLAGWLSFDQTDFNQALLEGRRDGREISAELTLAIADIDSFATAERKRARVSAGVVECPELGGRLEVDQGVFELFVAGAPRFDHLHLRMRYTLDLRDPHGRELRLHGFKVIENDPGYDSWSDTTTLFVRIHARSSAAAAADAGGAGDQAPHASPAAADAGGAGDQAPAAPPVDDQHLLATGVLRIDPAGVLHEFASFRGTEGPPWSRLRDIARFGGCFVAGLAKAYLGRPIPDGQPSFPRDHPRPPWAPVPAESGWHRVPGRGEAAGGRHALERNIISFTVPDLAFPLNLHHLRRAGEDARGEPVLLVHGSGVRAEMFYGQPVGVTIVDCLLSAGYDVWAESWRSSIDFPPNSYTLDLAAMHDHPAAVARVLEQTRSDSLRAVVHCQGSISFLMSITAGFLDGANVSHLVSSAISLFFEVPGATWVKQRTVLPFVRAFGTGGDPQWGIRPQTPAGALLAWLARHTERPCGNAPCQIANYLFGSGWDVLFRHENVDDAVHAWCARELGYTPFSLIGQVAESCRYGHIVPSADSGPGTPPSYLRGVPPMDTRFTFLAGDHNRMFKPTGQRQAYEFVRQCGLDARFELLPGYGHLDTFWGKDAAREVFPIIHAGLEDDRSPAGGAARDDGEVRLKAPEELAAFGRRRHRRQLRFSAPPVARSRVPPLRDRVPPATEPHPTSTEPHPAATEPHP